MVPSDTAPFRDGVRRRRWASVVVGLGALVLVLAAVVATAVRGADDERLDEIDRAFGEHRNAFEAAVDRIDRIAADHPDALRIGWSLALVCVTDATGAEQCTDTSEEQRAAFRELSGASTVIRQSKDGGRVFFVFDVEDPPITYLLHDPDGRDPRAYAQAQGFGWGRQIDGRWSVLGHIKDVQEHSSMWVG